MRSPSHKYYPLIHQKRHFSTVLAAIIVCHIRLIGRLKRRADGPRGRRGKYIHGVVDIYSTLENTS